MKILMLILILILNGCAVVIVKAPVDSLFHHEQRADKMTIDQKVSAVDEIGVAP